MNSESLSGALPPPDPLAAAQRRWRPLSAIQRRVVGVLVEKAKTTPEQYPLSLNGLTTGSNQKSNRHPLMNLDTDQVEQALEELRSLGAVVEIQSGGRVAKYKHCLYEWLGVDKAELAVMTELLLRGEQTVGELRGRAARMEPIADLDALRPVLASLIAKELVVELTPEGRGQVVSHALHREHELAALKEQYQRGGNAEAARRRGRSVASRFGEPPGAGARVDRRIRVRN
jgi:uncharacterized protein YceH (UPF0502 family)